MIHALLRGKLSREQENMEDILTSNVFGLLSYLPPAEGLLPFLARAEDADGNKPLEFLLSPPFGEGTGVEYEFWPFWSEENCHGCEPDVVMTIRASRGAPVMVGIEAKYWSGKSSEADDEQQAPTDQLAREWDNLRCIAARTGARPYLLYITTDVCCPQTAIEASVAEWSAKRADAADSPAIGWLSWRHLHHLPPAGNRAIREDLVKMLERLNLTFFRGFTFRAIEPIDWSFGTGQYQWNLRPMKIEWSFS